MTGESKKQGEMGRLEGELSRLWQNRYVIFLSAMTCFAMLGNMGNVDSRAVHAQASAPDSQGALLESEIVKSIRAPIESVRGEDKQDTIMDNILLNITEKNLELIKVGIDPRNNALLHRAIQIEALGNSGISLSIDNLEIIEQVLGKKLAMSVIEWSEGDLECEESIMIMALNGLIDEHLMIPGNSAYASIKELRKIQGYKNKKLFHLEDWGNAKVVAPSDINDPELWDHKVSTWYISKTDPDHAIITFYDQKSGKVIKISSNEMIIEETGTRVFGIGGLMVEIMTREELYEYLRTYNKNIFKGNLYQVSMAE